MSLPLAFETTLRNVPDSVPYLSADPEAVEDWRRRMAGPELKVGLVWAGRPEHKRDRHRSMALAELAPLASIPNVAFYALQKGAAVGEAEHAPEGMRLEILSPLLGDFADTAAAIMALDLVITVDTSVAHLAGALGKPVLDPQRLRARLALAGKAQRQPVVSDGGAFPPGCVASLGAGR